MLEDIQFNFFDSTEVGEVDRKSPETATTSNSDNFGSLFAELIADSLVESSCDNMTDLLVESDSNDSEIEQYFNSKKVNLKSQPAANKRSDSQRQTVADNTNSVSLRQPRPVINVDHENDLQHSDINDSSWKSLNGAHFDKEPHIDINLLEARGKCTNRNALNARLNRMRKKQYVNELETKVDSLTQENKEISGQLNIKTRKLREAEKEIAYLRSVISNQKGLMSLLGNISNTAGVKLNASLVFTNNNIDDSEKCHENSTSRKRPLNDSIGKNEYVAVKKTRNGLYIVNNKDENDRSLLKKISKNDDDEEVDVENMEPSSSAVSVDSRTSGGVCLHVANDKVSIELCSYCASSAENSWEVAAAKSR